MKWLFRTYCTPHFQLPQLLEWLSRYILESDKYLQEIWATDCPRGLIVRIVVKILDSGKEIERQEDHREKGINMHLKRGDFLVLIETWIIWVWPRMEAHV